MWFPLIRELRFEQLSGQKENLVDWRPSESEGRGAVRCRVNPTSSARRFSIFRGANQGVTLGIAVPWAHRCLGGCCRRVRRRCGRVPLPCGDEDEGGRAVAAAPDVRAYLPILRNTTSFVGEFTPSTKSQFMSISRSSIRTRRACMMIGKVPFVLLLFVIVSVTNSSLISNFPSKSVVRSTPDVPW
jgi:hypothetical protein